MFTVFAKNFSCKRTDVAICVLKFEGKKPKIVDFFLMANFLWSFFSEPKNHSKTWTSGCPFEKNGEPPDATQISDLNLRMPLFDFNIVCWES